MTDEHRLIQAVGDAARAEALMRDEVLAGIVAQLEADYVEAWRATAVRDTDARERLWQAINLLGKVKDHLGRVIQNGKIAKAQIADLEGKRARKAA